MRERRPAPSSHHLGLGRVTSVRGGRTAAGAGSPTHGFDVRSGFGQLLCAEPVGLVPMVCRPW
jgi:hypothetical protein